MEGKLPASPVVGSRVQSQQVLGNEERMKGSQIGAEEKKPAIEITAKFFEKLYSSKVIQADPLNNAVGVICCMSAYFTHSPSPLLSRYFFRVREMYSSKLYCLRAHKPYRCRYVLFSILLVITDEAKATSFDLPLLALFA